MKTLKDVGEEEARRAWDLFILASEISDKSELINKVKRFNYDLSQSKFYVDRTNCANNPKSERNYRGVLK